MDKEIVRACIKYKNKLFTGFDHGECFDNLLKEEQPKDMTELEQGFIDNELNFVDRKSAMEIANISGQLKFKPVKETLISEDLHLDWLNRQAKQIADLEAKLLEFAHRISDQNEEILELKQQLSETDKLMQEYLSKCLSLEQQLTESENKYNDSKELWAEQFHSLTEQISILEKQLAEKEKECAVWERAYEYAIFECDFYKNHTQTTNEETMKRIEQIYEKILKRAKSLMEDK